MLALVFLSLIVQDPAPIGVLVDLGGYRVHLNCMGEGSPAVVVTGGFSVDWALVQPRVAAFTRICTYDVAGTAWSDPGPSSTCRERVEELHGLVKKAGIGTPFVLTGFSVGGLVTRFYVSRYPEDVSGVVFVDHAFTPKPAPASAQERDSNTRPVLIFQTPIRFEAEDASQFQKLPSQAQELHRWAAARRPEVDQSVTADSCLLELEGHPSSLGTRPLVVVSTGNEAHGYRELQTELLSLSASSQQMNAERSFHSVEIDQPDVVVAAIRAVVEQVRKSRPLAQKANSK